MMIIPDSGELQYKKRTVDGQENREILSKVQGFSFLIDRMLHYVHIF